MTLTEEFALLLDQLGLGDYRADGSVGGDIFLTLLPQSPDDAIAIARYAGGEADSTLGYDPVRIQIRIRANNHDVRQGETRAQAIYNALHGLGSHTLPGGTWSALLLSVNGGPVYMGRDDNGRHEWALNLRTEIRNPSTHRI